MKLDILENHIRLLSYWVHSDESVIDKLLDPQTELKQNWEDPFKKELDKNILEKETFESKRALFKHYIFEFWELQGFFKHYAWFIFKAQHIHEEGKSYYAFPEGSEMELVTVHLLYVEKAHELFCLLFDEIQLSCFKNNINIYELCQELDFSSNLFDSGVTMAFTDNKEFSKNLMQKSNVNAKSYDSINTVAPGQIFTNQNELISPEISYGIEDDLKNERYIGKMSLMPKVKIQSFPDYFTDTQNKQELAKICKQLFGVLNRGKADAIMMCILSQGHFIAIPNKQRSNFYRSWYTFIEFEIPKNKRFVAINNYITDYGSNGFVYKNTDDIDYKQLELKFSKLSKSNN